MWAEIAKLRGTTDTKGQGKTKATEKDAPRCGVCGSTDHIREKCPVWPPGVGEALSVDVAQGMGLHNLTAKALKHSPELLALPRTSWGVPDVARMDDTQKADFMDLLGIAKRR